MKTVFFPTLLLGVVVCLPVLPEGVSGGAPCTGLKDSYSCTATNGAMCNDLGNIFESTDEEADQVVRKGSTRKWCKVENGNNDDCSGGKWNPDDNCG